MPSAVTKKMPVSLDLPLSASYRDMHIDDEMYPTETYRRELLGFVVAEAGNSRSTHQSRA